MDQSLTVDVLRKIFNIRQVKRINELTEFIEQQDSELIEFDESLARRWIKEIVVWDDRFSVELKSGVIIEIEI